MNKKLLLFFCFLFTAIFYGQIESELYLEGATVTGIAKTDGYLWVATYGQGIYRYSFNDGKWINFSTKSGNLGTDLFYSIEVNKDFVWAGSTEGLFTYNVKRKNWSVRKFAQGGQFGNWIRVLKYDRKENILWIGRFRNITRFDVKKRRFVDINRLQGEDQKSNNFKSIAFDGDSLIWFGSESGVHIYDKSKNFEDPASWRYITNKKRGFKEEGKSVSVSSMLFESNNIWFGTDEFTSQADPGFNLGGIYIYDRKLDWQKISQVNGLSDNGIYSLVRTGNYIWAGVYSFDKKQNIEQGKGLFLINRNNLKVKKVDLNKLNVRTSTFLTFYFDGVNLWIGTNDGLLRIKIFNSLAKLEKSHNPVKG